MVELIPLTELDLEFLLEIRNDPTTRCNLENNLVFTIEECIEWYSLTRPKWYIISHEGIKVGYFRTNDLEIGCDIHPKFRKKGYARAAYESYLESVLEASLWVFEDNFAKNLYVSLGFRSSGLSKIVRERNYENMRWKRNI